MEKSCQVIEILFWIGIGIVFYTYLGYGIVLYLMVKIKELFVKPRLPRLPTTTQIRLNCLICAIPAMMDPLPLMQVREYCDSVG